MVEVVHLSNVRRGRVEGFSSPDLPGRRAPKALGKAALPTTRAAENALLARARKGDRVALEKLLTAASAPAWRWSRGFCRNDEDARDLVQDVLHTLLRSFTTFRGDATLSTWTYVVARRACMRRQQRARRSESLDTPAMTRVRERADQAPGPSARVERRELSARLEDAIAALPMPQRQVLVMRDVEGLSAAEVAGVLGIGERAVKSRLHRARLNVRAALAPYVKGGDAPEPSASCPETARLLSRYLEGELSAETCKRMEQHVRGCEACNGACMSLRSVLSACRTHGSGPVPRDVQRAVREAVREAAQTG